MATRRAAAVLLLAVAAALAETPAASGDASSKVTNRPAGTVSTTLQLVMRGSPLGSSALTLAVLVKSAVTGTVQV